LLARDKPQQGAAYVLVLVLVLERFQAFPK
jgi:hypothetical protein